MSRMMISRRGFMAATGVSAASAAEPAALLPTVALGKHRVTRLIAGSNPVNGISHCTKRLSELMDDWFTVERATEFVLGCERNGINTWQSSYWPKVRDALNAARGRGSKIQFICLSSGKQANLMKEILALQPFALSHHGGVTDTLFYAGRHLEVHDYIKKTHDLGLLAGMSSHNPDHLAYAEDAGWETDFYMGCFYNVTRPKEAIRRMLGSDVLGELFLARDPELMTARIRQIKKPCLGFKILAAGRNCDSAAGVERSFAFAYKNIKPGDAAIVGMYPVRFDEIQANAELARKYA